VVTADRGPVADLSSPPRPSPTPGDLTWRAAPDADVVPLRRSDRLAGSDIILPHLRPELCADLVGLWNRTQE
jgi:hypothetical protein